MTVKNRESGHTDVIQYLLLRFLPTMTSLLSSSGILGFGLGRSSLVRLHLGLSMRDRLLALLNHCSRSFRIITTTTQWDL